MNVTVGQTILITAQAFDGSTPPQPTKLNGVPVWVSSAPDVYNPTVSADGLTATGVFLKTGTVTMTATPDATKDPHCGPGTISFTGIAGDAVTLVLSAAVVPAA